MEKEGKRVIEIEREEFGMAFFFSYNLCVL